MSKLHLIDKLQLPDEKEKVYVGQALASLAKAKDNKYCLLPKCYKEIDFEKWSYTDMEKQVVKKRALEAFDSLNLPADAMERRPFLSKDELNNSK